MTDPAQERIKSLEQRLAQEPQSALFARLADCYLQAGRANDALRLCDDGLALYPFYTTAHLVKAKVLTHLGMTAEARHAYEVVHEFLPTNESVARLTSSIEPSPAQEVETAPVSKETVETEVAPASAPEVVVEEAPVKEAQQVPVETAPTEEVVAAEEPTMPVEEPPAQEPVTEEPQAFQPTEAAPAADDSFGFGEQQVAEPQPEEPSAADKLGLDIQPDQQQTSSDFGFGAPVEEPPIVAAAEEEPFGSQPLEEPQRAIEPEPAPEPAQESPSPEAPVMEAAPVTPEPAPAPEPTVDQTSDWADAFSQLQQPAAETVETPATPPAEEENPFAMFGAEQPSTPVEGEPYEEFTARVRMELFGTEDSVTLEEYLAQAGSVEPPQAPADNIGDLAEKLKTSQRITPPVINFSEKAPRPGSESDTPGGSGFVTPTLAEIYVKQGWYDDAIKAYRALATNKPTEKEKFEQRIAEIEEMKKSSK